MNILGLVRHAAAVATIMFCSAMPAAATQHGIGAGSVVVGSTRIDYAIEAATITVKGRPTAGATVPPEAAMFYVAYFRSGVETANRPITFVFNGGPGSSAVWLHLGAFGPKKIAANGTRHVPAPYELLPNADTLLDVSDLVFVDAPGTGFSPVPADTRAFYGIDQDANAFAEFIVAFLKGHGRWSSPKYLLGASYGTPRAAVASYILATRASLDFNGLILVSPFLNMGLAIDDGQFEPGHDMPYVTAFPSYAAAAWYHDRLPGKRPDDLSAFLAEVEQFAATDYLLALQAGAALPAGRRREIAVRMSRYSGLPVDLILAADLRINPGVFGKGLLADKGLVLSRRDTRYTGAPVDPLAREADYDPQWASIRSAYLSAINQYARADLHYESPVDYISYKNLWDRWDFRHQPPGASAPRSGFGNTLPDLAAVMKQNPDLKLLVLGGYFDNVTPFARTNYDFAHLPIPQTLRGNIESHFFPVGHMLFDEPETLTQARKTIVSFIGKTAHR